MQPHNRTVEQVVWDRAHLFRRPCLQLVGGFLVFIGALKGRRTKLISRQTKSSLSKGPKSITRFDVAASFSIIGTSLQLNQYLKRAKSTVFFVSRYFELDLGHAPASISVWLEAFGFEQGGNAHTTILVLHANSEFPWAEWLTRSESTACNNIGFNMGEALTTAFG